MRIFKIHKLDEVENLILDYRVGNKKYWKKQFNIVLTTIKQDGDEILNIFNENNRQIKNNDDLIHICAMNPFFINAFYKRNIPMNNFKSFFLRKLKLFQMFPSEISRRNLIFLRECCKNSNRNILNLFDSMFKNIF
jgi:hypothetical protein